MSRLFFVFLIFGTIAACVSSGEDYEVAASVGKYLNATGVVPADTREADRTHNGKIVYVAPGRNGAPYFIYYEVTDAAEMQKLKRAAELALKEVPRVRMITLHFMEKQVFHQSANGSGSRGRERELETIVVERER